MHLLFILTFFVCVVFLPRYLEVEWEVRKGSQRSFGKDVMKGSSPRVPQQDNFSDCGVYVLQYVESFFEVKLEITLAEESQESMSGGTVIV